MCEYLDLGNLEALAKEKFAKHVSASIFIKFAPICLSLMNLFKSIKLPRMAYNTQQSRIFMCDPREYTIT
jgi:hypothetical protein